jgi:competence protein ComEC
MQVHFINVGYGEAILIIRNDFTILVDGGTNRTEEYNNPGCIRVSDYLKKIGVSRVDLIIVTHIHDDHIGGIPEVVKSFPVSRIWINLKPGLPDLKKINQLESVIDGNLSGVLFRNALESYADLLAECERRGIPVEQKGSGDGFLPLDGGGCLELLAPDYGLQAEMLDAFKMLDLKLALDKGGHDAETLFYEIDKRGNSSSIALRIRAGKTGVLLSGDKVDGWEEIHKKYGNKLESQILKLTHHGQADGMPQAMLEAAQPDIFVICASIDRRFNSAHPAIIERAGAYLRERSKFGGVYITGDLRPGDTGCTQPEAAGESGAEKQYCAVCFYCDENTGKITAKFEQVNLKSQPAQ